MRDTRDYKALKLYVVISNPPTSNRKENLSAYTSEVEAKRVIRDLVRQELETYDDFSHAATITERKELVKMEHDSYYIDTLYLIDYV